MQVFLPALPMIQDEFAVSSATAQLTLSLSAFSIAVAMLAFGPLSDRFGRRPAMIGGLVVYLLGSIVCAARLSIGTLILGRIVQAAGGCAGLVLTRAIIRDLYDRDRSATMLAYITMAMVAAPMLAPAHRRRPHRPRRLARVFVVGGVLGVVDPARRRRRAPRDGASPGRAGAASRHAASSACCACARSGLRLQRRLLDRRSSSASWPAAPFLMVRVLGRPASEYGLMFVLISGAFMLGNFAAAPLRPARRPRPDDRPGRAGLAGRRPDPLALVMAGIWTPWALFLPTSLGAFAQGLALPNTQAAVVSVDPSAAGAASGLAGFLQMGLAGLAAQIVGSIQDGTPYPMVIGMTFCAVISLLCALAAAGGRRAQF